MEADLRARHQVSLLRSKAVVRCTMDLTAENLAEEATAYCSGR